MEGLTHRLGFWLFKWNVVFRWNDNIYFCSNIALDYRQLSKSAYNRTEKIWKIYVADILSCLNKFISETVSLTQNKRYCFYIPMSSWSLYTFNRSCHVMLARCMRRNPWICFLIGFSIEVLTVVRDHFTLLNDNTGFQQLRSKGIENSLWFSDNNCLHQILTLASPCGLPVHKSLR